MSLECDRNWKAWAAPAGTKVCSPGHMLYFPVDTLYSPLGRLCSRAEIHGLADHISYRAARLKAGQYPWRPIEAFSCPLALCWWVTCPELMALRTVLPLMVSLHGAYRACQHWMHGM